MNILKPWIEHTPEQLNALTTLADRLQANNLNITNNFSNYGVKSYTTRANMISLSRFLNAYPYNQDTDGKFENLFLKIMMVLSPLVIPHWDSLVHFRDRGGTETHDPIQTPEEGAYSAYIPKGITNFVAPNKSFDEVWTAELQRTIIKSNIANEECPEQDKSLTVKVFMSEGNTPYYHIYFNKNSPITLRQIMYYSFYKIFFLYSNPQHFGKDAEAIKLLMDCFFMPTQNSADSIIKILNSIIEERVKAVEENLIEDFSTTFQKRLNNNRKNTLQSAVDNDRYNMESYYQSFNEAVFKHANSLKALAEYDEVPFESIKVFLELIKKDPGCKRFYKYSDTEIAFIIEAPLLFTDEKSWSRILGNQNSTFNYYAKTFAQNYANYYKTDSATLFFAVTKLASQIFVDKTIKFYFSSHLKLSNNQNSFQFSKLQLEENGNHFPHPHLMMRYFCWGNSAAEISKAIANNDGETAFQQFMYSMGQMSADDYTILELLSRDFVESRYAKVTVFQKKGTTERTTFKNLIKEIVADETNKAIAEANRSSEE